MHFRVKTGVFRTGKITGYAIPVAEKGYPDPVVTLKKMPGFDILENWLILYLNDSFERSFREPDQVNFKGERAFQAAPETGPGCRCLHHMLLILHPPFSPISFKELRRTGMGCAAGIDTYFDL